LGILCNAIILDTHHNPENLRLLKLSLFHFQYMN